MPTQAGADTTEPAAPNGHAEAASGGDAGRPVAEPGGTLAAALAMIDRLPLTPGEKADAVRQLLGLGREGGKP